MNETERTILLRKFTDAYGRWFPSQVKDKELWGTVKRGISELLEKYPDECRRHEGLFDSACRAGSVGQHENLGFVLEEFKTQAILADNKALRERQERALPRVSEAGLNEYREKLERVQRAFYAGTITRGQWLSAIERAAREEGLSEDEVASAVEYARKAAEARPGGLDGTFSARIVRPVSEAMEEVVQANQQPGVERVESDGR